MKKIILVLISIILLGSFNISAEEKLIEGLKESWDTLWLKNYFTQEQMEDMVQQQQEDFTEYFYSFPWNLEQTIWGAAGLNQEETLKYHLEMQRPNPNEGIRAYLTTKDFKYAKQYYQENKILN